MPKLPEFNPKPLKGDIDNSTLKHFASLNNFEIMKEVCQTEKAKEKRASWHRGRKRSQEFKDACSKRKKGVKIGPVPSKYVPVIATNVKTNEEIKFDGQVLAAQKLNLKVCNISSVLNGRQATTAGWTFRYV